MIETDKNLSYRDLAKVHGSSQGCGDGTASASVGNLSDLKTTDKSNIVAAINEVKSAPLINSDSCIDLGEVVFKVVDETNFIAEVSIGDESVKEKLLAYNSIITVSAKLGENNAIKLSFLPTSVPPYYTGIPFISNWNFSIIYGVYQESDATLILALQTLSVETDIIKESYNPVASGGVYNALQEQKQLIGEVSSLATTEKGSLVAAVNELVGKNTSAESASSQKDKVTAQSIVELEARIKALEDSRGLLGDATAGTIDVKEVTKCLYPLVMRAHGVPAEANVPENLPEGLPWDGIPAFVGQLYINLDAASGGLYYAAGHDSVNDWKQA